MNITNQKPAILSPVYTDNIANQNDITKFIHTTITGPVFTPLMPGTPVVITEQKKQISETDLTANIINCMGDTINPTSEALVKKLMGKALVNFPLSTALNVNMLFPMQSGKAANLPEPSGTCVYVPAQDVIPNARKFLAGICDYDTFFASLAYYARPEMLGFYFANEIAFDNFKTWFASQTAMLGNILSNETNKLCTDFQTLTLNELTEALVIRNNHGENDEPNSFARLIVAMLMNYTNVTSNAEFGILPFLLTELYNPTTIIFVNVEAHSKASAKAVADEWNMVNNAKKQNIQMISNNKLTRLTATQRNLKKIAQQAATAASNASQNIQKAATFRFRKTEPNSTDIAKVISKVMSKMAFVNRSQNVFRQNKVSFAKPNRRDPDDYNKPGKIISIKFKPDLHIYIDTSGSISSLNYQDSILMLIAMAKKLNINIYFNSFSHILSQTTKLKLENKTRKQIYAEFERVPKVNGGTDYTQIWHFINKSAKRRKELSVIITDFAFIAPTQYIKHPKNLYYIPCAHMDWDEMIENARNFAASAMHNEPAIRSKILF